MKYLVTGANGFVGSALCEALERQGYATHAVVRHHSAQARVPGHFAVGNMDATTDWSRALVGVQVVVHLAARVHVMRDTSNDPLAEFRKVNVQGSLHLAQQAAAAGVRRFVYTSSVKVNGEFSLPGKPMTEGDAETLLPPTDAYGLSKYEAEQGLRTVAAQTGMELVIIRPPLVYGPGVKANFAALVSAVQSGIPLPIASVHNLRSLVALDNLVDFIITCAKHPQAANQTFLVSDGADISTPELARRIAMVAGVRARLFSVPERLLMLAASVLGKAAAMQRLCGNLQVDISKARELLQWVPPVSLDQGLGRIVSARSFM